MPSPQNYTYYLSTSSFSGTTFGALSMTPPPTTNTTWGWNVRQNNPPLFSEMNYGLEIDGADPTHWSATPSASAPVLSVLGSGGGNCWMCGPFNGEFLQGKWNITMSVNAVTNKAAHTGRFHYRFWSSPTGSGANASLISNASTSSREILVLSSNLFIDATGPKGKTFGSQPTLEVATITASGVSLYFCNAFSEHSKTAAAPLCFRQVFPAVIVPFCLAIEGSLFNNFIDISDLILSSVSITFPFLNKGAIMSFINPWASVLHAFW